MALRILKNKLRKEAIIKLVIAQIMLGALEENIDAVIDRRFNRHGEGANNWPKLRMLGYNKRLVVILER